MSSKPYIKHLVAEIYGIEQLLCDSDKYFKSISLQFKNLLGIKVRKSLIYHFKPQGTTYLLILAESHMAIHSWPENEYIHIDFLTCTPSLTCLQFKRVTEEIFKGKKINIQEVEYSNRQNK